MTSIKEIETKIAVPDNKNITATLTAHFISLIKERYFEDNWCFDFEDRRLTKNDILLRIRTANGVSTLTLKGPAKKKSGLKFRDEWEIEISKKSTLLKIFKTLNLKLVFRYQKYRTVYKYLNSLICLDETPIGSYLELEGKEEEIIQIAALLGFSPKHFIPISYASLFKLYQLKQKVKCKNMVF